MVKQIHKNRFSCIPRNSSLFITSEGNYLYCYNDMSHHHSLGNVKEMSVREAIELRELTEARGDLCDQCNMKGRYQGAELVQMAAKYMGSRLIAAVG
ncbi:SPASM domain-containing protein [Aestuariirhabdus sp. LZHN29]|uniref:SPASM domain-containing protein n=1 Tax=Aestuariirhabdus sp. LZHN29 TaxID=3417462 RepID=UPI003CF746A9